MSHYKNGFKFGLGLLTAATIGFFVVVGTILVIEYIEKKNSSYTNETGIKLDSETHWFTQDSLIFSGTVSYDGELKWQYIDLSFKVKDVNGTFSDVCRDRVYKPSFKDKATIKFKAKCYEIPKNFVYQGYEFETSGVH